jgi:hypothetical protein
MPLFDFRDVSSCDRIVTYNDPLNISDINYKLQNMIDKIDRERRHSMNAAPTRPSNKRQRQGAQEDPKEIYTLSILNVLEF